MQAMAKTPTIPDPYTLDRVMSAHLEIQIQHGIREAERGRRHAQRFLADMRELSEQGHSNEAMAAIKTVVLMAEIGTEGSDG